jgi:two-component system response regulator
VTAPLAQVLLVEDDAGDELIAREAFESDPMPIELHVVRDGVEALDFIFRRGAYADAPRPDFILLDLNLPRVDGRSVLRTVKDDPELSTIPVIVFSTSARLDDVLACYRARSNAYITKPSSYDAFVHVVREINQFWLDTVTLPPAA